MLNLLEASSSTKFRSKLCNVLLGRGISIGSEYQCKYDGKVIMAPENRIAAFKAINKAIALSDTVSEKSRHTYQLYHPDMTEIQNQIEIP